MTEYDNTAAPFCSTSLFYNKKGQDWHSEGSFETCKLWNMVLIRDTSVTCYTLSLVSMKGVWMECKPCFVFVLNVLFICTSGSCHKAYSTVDLCLLYLAERLSGYSASQLWPSLVQLWLLTCVGNNSLCEPLSLSPVNRAKHWSLCGTLRAHT